MDERPAFSGKRERPASRIPTSSRLPFRNEAGRHSGQFPTEVGVFVWVSLLPFDLTGVTSIYTLINSGLGVFGADVGRLTFTDTASNVVFYDLVEGNNIRDHYNGFYNNIATGLAGTAQFDGGVRLDMQEFDVSGFGSNSVT